MAFNIFKFSIETEIIIKAPKEKVWQILINFTDYHLWNPHLHLIEGTVNLNEKLKVYLHWPNLQPNQYQLRITNIDEYECLGWLGCFKRPGLLDGQNYFRLQSIDSGKTKVTHQEYFSGCLVPIFKPWLKSSVARGFTNIDQALVSYCEKS